MAARGWEGWGKDSFGDGKGGGRLTDSLDALLGRLYKKMAATSGEITPM